MTAADGERGELAVPTPGTLTGTQREPAVVLLPAEIDICNDDEVHASLSLALADGISVLVADATQTGFCDCSGVHALMRVRRDAAAAGVRFRVAASPAMRRILALTGADELLNPYLSLADAIAADV